MFVFFVIFGLYNIFVLYKIDFNICNVIFKYNDIKDYIKF